MATATIPSKKECAQPFKLGSEMVLIYAEKSDQAVQVHRSVITQSSLFFKKALGGGFREKQGIIHLPEQSKENTEIYVEWCYFGYVRQPTCEVDNCDEERQYTLRQAGLLKLYCLADALQDHKFSNKVMDKWLLEADAKKKYPIGEICTAWTRLPSASPMRKYFKDVWVTVAWSGWYTDEWVKPCPIEFWVEVAALYSDIREKKLSVRKPTFAERCRYHYHDDGESCTQDKTKKECAKDASAAK